MKSVNFEHYTCKKCKEKRIKMYATTPDFCPDCESSFIFKTNENKIFNRLLRERLSEKRAKEIASLLMSEEANDIMSLYDY